MCISKKKIFQIIKFHNFHRKSRIKLCRDKRCQLVQSHGDIFKRTTINGTDIFHDKTSNHQIMFADQTANSTRVTKSEKKTPNVSPHKKSMFVVALQSLASKLPWSLPNLSLFLKSSVKITLELVNFRISCEQNFKNRILAFYFCQKIKLTLEYPSMWTSSRDVMR